MPQMCRQNSSSKEKSPAVWIKKSKLKVTITQSPATRHWVPLWKLFSFPTKKDSDLYTEEGQTVIVRENKTKIACSIFLGTWKIHYRSLHSNNEAWQVNELLLVESQERRPVIQKFLHCTNASLKDDCNLVKPKIRRSGSFKQQNTWLVLR